MARQKFQLSSDQLELLLAFEQCKSLGQLAEQMGRDRSVVSRNLQRVSESFPVLAKINGRWQLTPLGRQVNAITQEFISRQSKLLRVDEKAPPFQQEPCFEKNALLMIINAQKGLLDPTLGGRSNSEAEAHIAALLSRWRKLEKPILHVKHVSENPDSLFYRKSEGSVFLPDLQPENDELVLEKGKASAFTGTRLNEILQELGVETIILSGFTANECIDATARDSADLGLTTYVVGDATAMFDIAGIDGKLIKAERVHRLTLANLNALYAKVISSGFLLSKS